MRKKMVATYSVSGRSLQFGVIHAAKIYLGRTQCVKFLEIVLFRSMSKVARARHQQRHATILAQCFGVAVALTSAWVHQAFHAGVYQ